MKKVWQIISVVLVIALSLSMTAFAEERENKVKLGAGSAEVLIGDGSSIVEIPLAFDGNIILTMIQVQVSFSDELKFVGYKEGDVVKGITEPALGTNPVIMPFVDTEIKGVEAKSGTFATLMFEVSNTEMKDYALVVEVVTAADKEYEDIKGSFECYNGLISVNRKSADFEISEERETAREARKQDVIALKINAGTAYTFGKTEAIDPDNSKVVPYLKNDRTLVPLRFVSETLGAEVKWETGWNYCYVIKGDKEIKITFNSADIEVNGQVVTYDAPVEVVQDRTMVPIRFISEELGYDVKWNQANQLVIITPLDDPWIEDRQAEKDVLEGILVTFLFNGIF